MFIALIVFVLLTRVYCLTEYNPIIIYIVNYAETNAYISSANNLFLITS